MSLPATNESFAVRKEVEQDLLPVPWKHAQNQLPGVNATPTTREEAAQGAMGSNSRYKVALQGGSRS